MRGWQVEPNMNSSHGIPAPAAVGVSTPAAPKRWRIAILALLAGLVVLGFLFRVEAAAAVATWETSTAYNHCWLIAPIAAWLFWVRRARLAALSPVPTPAFALLALPGTLAWLAAERLGIMEGRQLAALGLALVLVLTIFGWRFCRAFVAPLAYLFFLVPFGGFLVGPLQHITARLIDIGLTLAGVSHYMDGLTIETPVGLFYVAEACAGLRFIVATLAFGALYALVIFRSPWRRLIVMALAITVPILANGVRAWGIIMLAEYLGSAQAAAADHIIYGWGFFSVVLLLLILAGLPFREDRAPPNMSLDRLDRPMRAPNPGRVVAASVCALLAIAIGPAAANILTAHVPPPVEDRLPLTSLAGCEAQEAMLVCSNVRIAARLLAFSPRATWMDVSRAYWQLRGSSDEALTFVLRAHGTAWEGRQEKTSTALLASWLDGRPAGHGLSSRLRQALNSVGLGSGAPVLVVIEAEATGGGAPPRPLLARLIEEQGETLAATAARRSAAH